LEIVSVKSPCIIAYVHILHRATVGLREAFRGRASCVFSVSPLVLVVPFASTHPFAPGTSDRTTLHKKCHPRLSTVNANNIAMAREDRYQRQHFTITRECATQILSLVSLRLCRHFLRTNLSLCLLCPRILVPLESLAGEGMA